MERMRARPKSLSVVMGICQPSSERARMPASLSSMVNRLMETCSPVETSTSQAALSGVGDHSSARESSLLVSPALAESTAMTLYPWARPSSTFVCTWRIHSRLATEVPPNFWTRIFMSVIHMSASVPKGRVQVLQPSVQSRKPLPRQAPQGLFRLPRPAIGRTSDATGLRPWGRGPSTSADALSRTHQPICPDILQVKAAAAGILPIPE